MTMQLPNTWGEGGALFAFSGMDGETDWHDPLVGSTLKSGRGFVFHTPKRPILRFGIRAGGRDHLGGPDSAFESARDDIVAGDVVVSHISVGGTAVRLEYVFADKDTVLARVTAEKPGSAVEVFVESWIDDWKSHVMGGTLVQYTETDCYALASSSPAAATDAVEGRVYASLAKPGEQAVFAWAFSPNGPRSASALVSRGLTADFDALLDRRLAFFRELPPPKTSDPDLARAYYKCASVLKVNCYSPQDKIRFPWTTPDRWPHRHMWIWDSAFHAIGLRHISGEWAENAIRAVLSLQRDNGFIPHTLTPDGTGDSRMIQPPILAWAAWKVYETTGNRYFLEYVYPRVARMLRYDCDALDSDKNGLSEWESGCASGMDNSPRFDQPIKDAIDLNCYIVNDARCLARIARELGKSDAEKWEKLADERAERINSLLWDPETRFYYDNGPDGKLVKVKTVAGFTPLLARICDADRAAALVEHLTSPGEFWRAFPVSSVSADEPTFCDNMWRGPVWVNFNCFLIDALPGAGRADVAEELRQKTLREIARWYGSDGVVYEFYDSEGTTNPIFLRRKRLGGPQAKRSAASLGATICDYNWTAALFIDLLQAR